MPKQHDDVADDHDDEGGAPGWEAIDAACLRLYPEQPEPFHYGSIPFSFFQPQGLEGVAVFRVAQPEPHWHYVSYGLSDLFGEQDGPDEDGDSGYGFELTFRLADPQAMTAEEPPTWPVDLLQNLSRYVFSTGNCFAANHHMDLGGKIGSEEETDLTAIGFVPDPDLGEIETPSGRVRFLQLFGLTGTDLDDVKAWSAEPLYDLHATRHPKHVTDLASGPLREDPEVARLIDEGKQRDGSQMERTFVDSVKVAEVEGRLEITIGARVAGELPGYLMGRLPFGRDFMLIGNEDGLTFESAESTSWELGEVENFLRLTPADLEQVVAVLEPKRGRHEAPAGVVWIIEPTEMKDPNGNVVEVIG
ncbi:suppressor of fused domain protein [Arachnia propionica]|uniref:Suppressor of fused domain protein n=1 Tax=Arachnia propionica TaxID=1750 RepID=A0A3P1WQJ1_9ACTN|nr:suppressor of fused domain protein [Arachnia propionica]RRD48889.1 suppressor of fused domain protein [Arachnia propionica]